MKTLVMVAVAAQLITVSPQNVQVIPLNEESDPVQISDARFELNENGAPVVLLTLANKTESAFAARDIWLTTQRFFTPAEMRRNGDHILFSCGIMRTGDADAAGQGLAPGGELPVKIELPPDCRLDHAHEHFYAEVSQISIGGRYGAAVWAREPAKMAELFKAARPHP